LAFPASPIFEEGETKDYEDEMIEDRRRLHEFPELSYHEIETASLI
jgi:metal-dependent amidase/aminoacylase/carboxypeptidase family protein